MRCVGWMRAYSTSARAALRRADGPERREPRVGCGQAELHLEVILRAADGGDGFGHVKFRQANDDPTIVDLGVWVRDLAPNTHYKLQRAVDTVLDDDCTSTSWLTLGAGSAPQDIVTDDGGTGRADLFRLLTSPIGTAFDIHFRVVTTGTPPAVALISECYQFFVR